MKKDRLKQLLYIVTIGLVLFMNVLDCIVYHVYFNVDSRIYSYYNISYIIIVFVIMLLLIYIINLIKSKFKLQVIDYLLYLLLIIGIVVCIFSFDFKTSFMGSLERNEGFLTLSCYYLLFVNWAKMGTDKDKSKLYKLIIFVAIVNVLYSLLQVYTDYDFVFRMKVKENASGMCGHNNFFGSLMVTALSMISCDFICNKKGRLKKLLIIIFLIIGLVNSQSAGPLLAYIFTMVFILIYLAFKKCINIKYLIIVFSVVLLLVSGITLYNKYVLKSDVCEICNFKENVIDNEGNGRWSIWQRTFTVVKKHPIIGIGYDNLKYLYPQPYDDVKITPEGVFFTRPKPINKKYYLTDNAHNVYLNLLVSSGIIGLIPYMILLLWVFIKGCKSKDKISFILFSGFIAYSVQAFVNISTIKVAPIYYLIIGIILSNNIEKKEEVNKNYKICFACSSGGHLNHLLKIKDFWKDKNRFWVTFNKEDSVKNLTNEKLYFCSYPTNRNIKNLIKNTFLAFKVLLTEKPDVIISSGAAIAVPFFYIGKLFGIKTVYIEIYDRHNSATLTGRLVYPVTDKFIVQWESMKKVYPKSIYLGSIF